MPYEAYIGYLTDNAQKIRGEIESGEPFILEVRDTDTFERLVVRAVVAMQANAIEDGEALWVLDWIESRMESPWSIRVLEEVDEDAADSARSDVTDEDKAVAAEESKRFGGKKYRGSQLPDSMGGEEARKFYENVVGKRQPK